MKLLQAGRHAAVGMQAHGCALFVRPRCHLCLLAAMSACDARTHPASPCRPSMSWPPNACCCRSATCGRAECSCTRCSTSSTPSRKQAVTRLSACPPAARAPPCLLVPAAAAAAPRLSTRPTGCSPPPPPPPPQAARRQPAGPAPGAQGHAGANSQGRLLLPSHQAAQVGQPVNQVQSQSQGEPAGAASAWRARAPSSCSSPAHAACPRGLRAVSLYTHLPLTHPPTRHFIHTHACQRRALPAVPAPAAARRVT